MHWRVMKLVKARGFGFARDSGGRLILFHRFEMKGTDFDALIVGADVEFDYERGPEGLRAVNIQRLED
jgi:cold shock CspA family protein